MGKLSEPCGLCIADVAQMMRTLNLNEGDPVRLNGAALPKGKMVKIQAQSTEFLQVSDPKAV
jgi:ubiquitin fusion degradation protein 1